jgi:carbamoyltransferase
MKILGISAHYHDSAAALVIDGVPVCAVQEERLSRRKNDASFPAGAIEWCLDHAGLDSADLNAVVFYERSMLKFERGSSRARCERFRAPGVPFRMP